MDYLFLLVINKLLHLYKIKENIKVFYNNLKTLAYLNLIYKSKNLNIIIYENYTSNFYSFLSYSLILLPKGLKLISSCNF